jgi:DNA-binding response OmpR family regulator
MALFHPRCLFPSILIIEDNHDHAELISRRLCKFEVRLTAVHAGHEGWQQLQASRVDLLILDYNLPDLDGLTLLKQLRHDNTRLPVVMVTAHRDRWLTEQACKYGASYFIVKTAESTYLRKLEEIVIRELGVTRRKQYSSTVDSPWVASLLKTCMN